MCIFYKILLNMKGTTKYIKTGIFCSRLKGLGIGIIKPWPSVKSVNREEVNFFFYLIVLKI